MEGKIRATIGRVGGGGKHRLNHGLLGLRDYTGGDIMRLMSRVTWINRIDRMSTDTPKILSIHVNKSEDGSW